MDFLDGIAVVLVALAVTLLLIDWRRKYDQGKDPWVLERDWDREDDQSAA